MFCQIARNLLWRQTESLRKSPALGRSGNSFEISIELGNVGRSGRELQFHAVICRRNAGDFYPSQAS